MFKVFSKSTMLQICPDVLSHEVQTGPCGWFNPFTGRSTLSPRPLKNQLNEYQTNIH